MDVAAGGSAGVTDDDTEIWLDRSNDAVFNTLERGVRWFDGLFDRGQVTGTRTKTSTYRVKLNVRVEEQGGPQTSVEPDAKVDLYLPNLSKGMQLHLRSTDIDELPGVDPTQEDTAWLLGVVRSVGGKRIGDFAWGVGAKFRPAPEPYITFGARRHFDTDPWYFTPAQRFFWSGDEGFGELTSFAAERVLGRQWGARSTSAAKWTEETEGVEWEQSLLLAFFPKGYARTRQSRQNMLGLRGSVFGHKDGPGVVDRYRVQLGWRRPMRRQWLYLDLVPGVDFENEDDWNEVLWFRFGFEVFFDGSARQKRLPSGDNETWGSIEP